jgi:hypothetical protein
MLKVDTPLFLHSTAYRGYKEPYPTSDQDTGSESALVEGGRVFSICAKPHD